ncbi:MAG TPA: alpha/beta hydrolase fold domain-containing protein, partial [Rhodopila sp.]
YRLSGEARFPAQVQDVKAAILFLRANAAKYGIDPARVLLWGGSAGGHLAALAATSCGVAAFEPEPSTGRLTHAAAGAARLPAVSDCVQGAVVWYGAFDLEHLHVTDPSELLGCNPHDCAAKAVAASPINHVSASTPPMLLIHGLADTEVPVQQSRDMAERLQKADVPVETMFIADVDHGFIGKTPDATRDANLTALQRSFDYIDAFFAK